MTTKNITLTEKEIKLLLVILHNKALMDVDVIAERLRLDISAQTGIK